MFSLSWFTSIPGILITVGVLLLVVALVIFIVTSQKNKKKGQGNEQNAASSQSIEQGPEAPSPTITPMPMDNGIQQASTIGQAVPGQPVSQMPPVTNVMPSPYSSPVADNNSTVSMSPTIPTMNNNIGDNNSSIYASSSNISSMPVQPYAQPTVGSEITSSPAMPSIAPEQDIVSNPVSMEVSTEPMINTAPMGPQFEVPIIQPVDSMNPVENLNINTNENVASVGVLDNNQANIVPPSTAPIVQPTLSTAPIAVEDSSSVVPVVETSSSPTSVTIPEISNSVDNITNNNINNVKQENVPATDISTPIYGGVSPIVPEVSTTQNTPQIYGGANPLENTQSVPISQIASDINQVGNNSIVNNDVMAQPVVQNNSVVDTPSVMQPEVSSSNVPVQNNIQQTPVVAVPQVPTLNDQAVSSMPIQDNVGVSNVNPSVAYQNIAAPQPAVSINTNVQ